MKERGLSEGPKVTFFSIFCYRYYLKMIKAFEMIGTADKGG